MSGIAGDVRFAEEPSPSGEVRQMCAAMRHRAVDGISFWSGAGVDLGHCVMRTTPESLRETQPLANQDGTVVLVMDGRVDDRDALRSQLQRRGIALRTDSDAELVLMAYEAWGEDCADRVIGEFVFVVWDARQRRVFAARDPAGARHFYYTQSSLRFAFASEIRGLLARSDVGRALNESRLLDFLVDEFDRDDEVGTCYEGIFRLPAGHAMRVTGKDVVTWRYWNPAVLEEARYASEAECVEAFMQQLRAAVRDRLRTVKPLGATLSGGLDSSSIVALIGNEYRGELGSPLRTFSLVGQNKLDCAERRSLEAVVRECPWLVPTVLEPRVDGLRECIDGAIRFGDEPFTAIDGLTYRLAYAAAAASGCGSVLDGMAGDLMFYSSSRSLSLLLESGDGVQLLRLLRAGVRHGHFRSSVTEILWAGLRKLPGGVLRRLRHRHRAVRALAVGDLGVLRRSVAKDLVEARHGTRNARSAGSRRESDQASHARFFTTGLLSFAHERNSLIAAQHAIEPISPFSDRRMLEFAVRMPRSQKVALPWYKYPLRAGTAGLLPDDVRWRTDVGTHPGPDFLQSLHEDLTRTGALARPGVILEPLERWVDPVAARKLWLQASKGAVSQELLQVLRLFIASHWMVSHGLG